MGAKLLNNTDYQTLFQAKTPHFKTLLIIKSIVLIVLVLSERIIFVPLCAEFPLGLNHYSMIKEKEHINRNKVVLEILTCSLYSKKRCEA